MPLTLTPARETAANGTLTGKQIKVLDIATLNTPEATLKTVQTGI